MSFKENGGKSRRRRRIMAKWEEIIILLLDHHQLKRFFQKWDVIFTVLSAFAVFIDPLICYVPVIVEDRTCYFWDQTLLWTFFALRSTFDLLYVVDIAVFLWRSGDKRNVDYADSFRASLRKIMRHRKAIPKWFYGDKSLTYLGVLPRICAALPILQAIILLGKYTYLDNCNLLYLMPIIQYTLRAYNLYRWLDRHSGIETAIRTFLKALLDFLPFILAAHLFGALWYVFALDRELVCWQKHVCEHEKICSHHEIISKKDFFKCGRFTEENNAKMINITLLKMSCAVEVSKDVTTLPFDFGIYLYALQSKMTRSRDLPMKLLQCLWWGLRNLSSFGSNLQTSFFKNEIIFSLVISTSGLALFLLYLNARVEGSQKKSARLKLRQKIRKTYSDILDEMRITSCLRMTLLKKVPMLKNMDENVLEAFCEHFKSVVYAEDSYIVREGEPLDKMIFIVQGTAWCYTPSASRSSINIDCLKKDDFCGEEILDWATKLTSFSDFPNSTRIVKAHTKVEVFAIRANHLRGVVSRFWWHFTKKLRESQLDKWQHLAASSIQAQWRRRQYAITTKRREHFRSRG